MLRTISIATLGAALVATIAHTAPFDRSYSAGMRIIHVPQPGETVATEQDDSAFIEHSVEPAKRPKRAAAPRRVLPPVADPKRTVLNTSPDATLSPIRPTPRWRGIEKFEAPPKSVVAAPVATDAVVAPIPADTVTPPEDPTLAASDAPFIDDDTPPPTE